MDLRVLFTAFWTVFLAELGDKTQLTVLSMGAATKSRWSVFAGASAALVASSLVAILVADQVAKRVNPRIVQGIAGGALIVMGAIYVYGAWRGPKA